MSTDFGTPAAMPMAPLAPLARTERIAALDVIRGFALIGILLMNIEYFNRPTMDIGSGIQPGQSGANLYFSLFVMYFVTGKFWTMFSLLFGMGFGVMLMRAETAQRSFLGPYMRRIAALAVFGALHYIFLWAGDILFSYSVAAVALLIVLYGRAKFILASIAVLIGIGFIPGMDWSFGIAGGIAFFSVCAWYLRCPERITAFKRNVPVFKIVIGLIMVGGIGTIIASFVMPNIPHEGRIAMPIAGTAFFILACLMARFHDPEDVRTRRMAVGIYFFQMLMMTSMGAAQFYFPDPVKVAATKELAALSSVEAAKLVIAAPVAAPAATAAAASAPAAPKAAAKDAKAEAKKLTPLEQAAKDKKERDERLAKRKVERDEEVRVLRSGSYTELVSMRATKFFQHAPGQVGFATLLITMFLLGYWFVRSGIMANTKAHLPLFRKLAFIGLPLGIGLGLLGSQIATHATPGTPNGFGVAMGLLMLGNMPACLGYASVIVLMLHSRSMFAKVSVLAPFGRMALTNYLSHSLVFSFIFFGYGLGMYGIDRIYQLGFVVAMVLVQIPLCHLWLTHFRYGPVEWLWRAITYWQIPAMRVAPAGTGSGQPITA
jgi:uncharacterized protein